METITVPAPLSTSEAVLRELASPAEAQVAPVIKTTSALTGSAEIYHAKLGRSRRVSSFDETLSLKLDELNDAKKTKGSVVEQATQTAQIAEMKHQATTLFTETAGDISPQVLLVLAEMKKLGIENDLELSPELKFLKAAVKADQWGERPAKDQPNIIGEDVPDPQNPNNQIVVKEGKVVITTLNSNIQTNKLGEQINSLLVAVKKLQGKTTLDPELVNFCVQQALERSVFDAKKLLRINPDANFEGARHIKDLNPQQASNKIELWQNSDGRQFIAKGGPLHTLQAEVLENRGMMLLGLPVPETSLQGDPPKLIVGYLDAYSDTPEKFSLPEYYQANRVLQRGLIADLLFNQYNRRAHNIMVKDGKIAFIDHGAATFCRATGGFKEFSSEVTTQNIWDLIRTIPDNDPNGDEPVNEAYANVLTVEGGENGKVAVKDPYLLRQELRRLSRIKDEDIAQIVDEAGYQDGEMAIDQIRWWLQDPDNPKGIQVTQARLHAIPPEARTKKDQRDLRWVTGAVETFEGAIAAGGMKSFLTKTLMERRDNLVKFFEPLVAEALSRETEQKQEVATRFADAIEVVTAHNESGNYNYLAMIEILLKSLSNPDSIPGEGYKSEKAKAAALRLKEKSGNLDLSRLSPEKLLEVQRSSLMALLEMQPVLYPQSIDILAKVATQADITIWTMGDVDDQDHFLPQGLISTDKLLGSGHQIKKLDQGRVIERAKEKARTTSGQEVLISSSITSDKVAQVPKLVEDALNSGHDQIVVFDDDIKNLRKVSERVSFLPADKQPQLTLILVNQGRKYSKDPDVLPSAGNQTFIALNATSPEVADAFLLAPFMVEQVREQGRNPMVLMDFDGVLGDNSAQRTAQVDTLYRTIRPHLVSS